MKFHFTNAVFAMLAALAHATNCPPNLGAEFDPEDGLAYPSQTTGTTLTHGNDDSLALFVGGGYTASGTAVGVEGRIYVAGNMAVDNTQSWVTGIDYVQVGQGSSINPNGGTDVALSKNARFYTTAAPSNGAGTILVKGSLNPNGEPGVFQLGTGGQVSYDPTMDFTAYDDLLASLVSKSQFWGALDATGDATIANSVLRLSGGNADACYEVFELTPALIAQLQWGHPLELDANLAGKTIIINMPAAEKTTATGIRKVASIFNISVVTSTPGSTSAVLDPSETSKILFNFFDADHVEIGSMASGSAVYGNGMLQGSVLAPLASVRFTLSDHQGRMIVGGDFHQESGTLQNYPFDPEGCAIPLPEVCDGVAEPTTTTIATTTATTTVPAVTRKKPKTSKTSKSASRRQLKDDDTGSHKTARLARA